MADTLPHVDTPLQRVFRVLNKFMMLMWRLGLGSWLNTWPAVGGRIMVLVHHGRKTGLARYNPLNYFKYNGAVYCISGTGEESYWYRNLRADPHVEIWLPDGWYAGLAEDITGCPEQVFLFRQVLIASGFAARLAGINPRVLSDQALLQAVAPYRLVRIHMTAERTGPGGPGEYSWIWPTAALFLLPLALRRRGRRR